MLKGYYKRKNTKMDAILKVEPIELERNGMSEKKKPQIQLEKVDDNRWRVPKTGKMNVDGMIYTNETLLPHLQRDATIQQVVNVAQLPGILDHSLAMPDAHQGYGFPIGGVAAFDMAQGVISPGGVGYDINCLIGDSAILHEHGYTRPIVEFAPCWQQEQIRNYDTDRERATTTKIVRFLEIEPKHDVYRVVTSSGKAINATADHPFYTKRGMVPLHELTPEDTIAVSHFQGIPYEEPSNDVILNEEDVKTALSALNKDSEGHAVTQILNHLKQRNLLSLRYNSPQLPYLLKCMGFLTGGGTIFFERGNGKGHVCFYGLPDDLESIRRDIEALGFTPSKRYKRERHSEITPPSDTYEFERTEHHFKVNSSSFAILLAALGVPAGKKTRQDFRVPSWIFQTPLWQKRLYLASFFGVELSTPAVLTEHDGTFCAPMLSQKKHEDYVESGKQFLQDISTLLNEFGVTTQKISLRQGHKGKQNTRSHCLHLILSGTNEHLIRLWGTIGFEYNQKRSYLANAAIGYLIHKEHSLGERLQAIEEIQSLRAASGGGAKTIYETRKTGVCPPENVPSFDEYRQEATLGLGESGFVWDTIREKTHLNYIGKVYDFTVAHHDHNFIANSFLVSNCGVRLMRSNLQRQDIQEHLRDLVAALFRNIPCGVGSQRSDLRLSNKNEQQVLVKGAQWAVSQGYGTQADLGHIEDYGCLAGANPDVISKRALKRGRPQLGTLGSGNHFVEIGYVEEIYNSQVASVLGLERDSITITVHTGSRGFGYQVCDDFLQEMLEASRKYGIDLPDRQLCCAPISSEEGQRYFSAMACAANYAFTNRQIITHWVRETFERTLGMTPRDLQMNLIYDVAHNIAKFEIYRIGGKERKVCVHRKGATRAFPAGHAGVPSAYQAIGQPVLIPGDMGRCSYVLIGTNQALDDTFGSTCHGAGRMLSRSAAKKQAKGRAIWREMEDRGVVVRSEGRSTLAEEMPEAYKDVSEVVDVVHQAGISRKIAKLRPLGVIKG